MSPEFRIALANFLSASQGMIDAYFAANYKNLIPAKLSHKVGIKYVKIVREGSVYCFVDLSNGDVLKAASWAAPAKGKRSNIFDADSGLSGVGPHGAKYLK